MSAILLGVRFGVRRFSVNVGRVPKRQVLSEAGVVSRRISRVSRGGFVVGCGAASLMWILSDPIQCASGGAGGANIPDPSQIISKFFNAYSDHVNEMGVSGLVGLCAGIAAKRISQEVAVTIGTIFMVLQVCSCSIFVVRLHGFDMIDLLAALLVGIALHRIHHHPLRKGGKRRQEGTCNM